MVGCIVIIVTMHPTPYIERSLKHGLRKRRDYKISTIMGLIILLIVMQIVAPLLHESLHIIILKILGCYYDIDLKFDWEFGVYGKLTTLSSINLLETTILLGIGILGNLLLGLILFTHGQRMRINGRHLEANIIVFTALGFFLGPISYFFSQTGDLMNILMLLGISEFSFILPLIGLSLFLFSSFYLYEHSKHLLDEYQKIKEMEKEIEHFLFGIRDIRDNGR